MQGTSGSAHYTLFPNTTIDPYSSFFDIEYDEIFSWVCVARVYSEKLVPVIAALTKVRDTPEDRWKVWRIVRNGNVEEATVLRRKH